MDYKGVQFFHASKGARALAYLYALGSGVSPESNEKPYFDIRQIPARYTENLTLEDTTAPSDDEDFRTKYENEQEAHREAMRRAIDDGYDFLNESHGSKLKAIFATIFNR